LGSSWVTAWRSAPVDSYLLGQLLKRKGLALPARPAKKAQP
jgi:hypothetical protein